MYGLPRLNCLPVWGTTATTVKASFRRFAGLASTQSVPCSNNKTDVKDFRIVNIASKLGINPDDVLQCVKVSPKLLASSPSQWEKCFTELQAQGFLKDDHLKMVTLNPAIISMANRHELSDVIDVWRQCKLGDGNMLHLLTLCPQLLSVKIRELEQRIPVLKLLANSNGKQLMRLLMGNPNVLFDNWKHVLAKIDYVKNVMDIKTEDENITKSYLFNKDLTELKVRYMFLKRAGIYVNPPKVIKGTKVEQMQQPWSKNPRLFQIIDTNEDEFIKRLAKGLCLEEFKVFRELYIKELEKEERDLEVDEDDEDDDDDEEYNEEH